MDRIKTNTGSEYREFDLDSLIVETSEETRRETQAYVNRMRSLDPVATKAELDAEYEASQAEARENLERYFEECARKDTRPDIPSKELGRMFDEYCVKRG